MKNKLDSTVNSSHNNKLTGAKAESNSWRWRNWPRHW